MATLRQVIRECGTCEGTGMRPGYKLQGEQCRSCGGAGHRFDGAAFEIRAALAAAEGDAATARAITRFNELGRGRTCERNHMNCSSVLHGECGR